MALSRCQRPHRSANGAAAQCAGSSCTAPHTLRPACLHRGLFQHTCQYWASPNRGWSEPRVPVHSAVVASVFRPSAPGGPGAYATRAGPEKRDLSPVPFTGHKPDLAAFDDLRGTTTVKFHLQFKTAFGQGVRLLGSHPKLGSWNIRSAVELKWTPGDQWVAFVDLPAGGVYEYKYVLIDFQTKQALEWQQGSNAVIAAETGEQEISVFDNWGNNPGSSVEAGQESMTKETKLQRWAREMIGHWKEALGLKEALQFKETEVRGVRTELAQLRMELSLERQQRMSLESRVTELQVDNANLQSQLMHKTMELNNTLSEVLELLNTEMADSGDDDDDLGDEGEDDYALEGNNSSTQYFLDAAAEDSDDDDEQHHTDHQLSNGRNGSVNTISNNSNMAQAAAHMPSSQQQHAAPPATAAPLPSQTLPAYYSAEQLANGNGSHSTSSSTSGGSNRSSRGGLGSNVVGIDVGRAHKSSSSSSSGVQKPALLAAGSAVGH